MFDFGLLPLIAIAGAGAVFAAALFIGEDVVIDKFEVSHQLEWTGYSSAVATRQLTDELRELNAAAASQLTGLEVDETELEKGISAFEDYFDIATLINGTRDLLGMIPFYIEGEITENSGQAVLIARVYTADESIPVHVVSAVGDPNDIPGLLHEGALGILQYINPYIVVLYHRQTEGAAQQFDFPKTHKAVERYFAERPIEEHYLGYGLLGRAHMLKAERDPNLTPEQRQAEYVIAERYLDAALKQEPDFIFPLINLGLIHTMDGEYAVAEQHFARAVEVNPNYLITRQAWGDLLIKQGRLRDAAIQYVAAVEIAPENPELRDKLAQLYADLGMRDAAREQWEVALQLSPMTEAYADRLRALGADADCAQHTDEIC